MFPDDSGAFQIVFGKFRSGGSPKKSDLFKNKIAGQMFCWPKIICWESFEMDCVAVLAGLELILGGKRSFEVWRTAVFERSKFYLIQTQSFGVSEFQSFISFRVSAWLRRSSETLEL